MVLLMEPPSINLSILIIVVNHSQFNLLGVLLTLMPFGGGALI
jgi:hypothetical protein